MLTGWEEGNPRLPGGGCNPWWTGADDRGVRSAFSMGHSLGRGMPERTFKAGAGDAHKLPASPLYDILQLPPKMILWIPLGT